MNFEFSSRVPKSDSDPVGDILKVAGKPGIISFAGGLPAPELFPIAGVKKAAEEVMDEDGAAALQYGSAKGVGKLIDTVVQRSKRDGVVTDADHVMISTGSQQAIDLTGKMFVDPGDTVIIERPTYLCAVDVFRSYGAHFVGVDMDDDGMRMDQLEQAIIDNPNTKVIYTVPNFQNPTGRTMSVERRKQMVQIAEKYNVMILEDNPYGAIRFTGENIPAVKSFDKTGHVIYMSTFSKILAPGIRVGWIVAGPQLIKKFTFMKQSADVHTDNFVQFVVAKFFAENDVEAHIKKISAMYVKRKDVMINAMKKYFPSDVKFSNPDGGMFLWVEVPGDVNTQAMFDECIKNNVAFVPGEPFYANNAPSGRFRLNFSNTPEDQIEIGIKRLASAIRKFQEVNA